MLLRGHLVARHLEGARGRSDERDAVLSGPRGEFGVLREESVPGIDRVGAGGDRDADDLLDVEVGTHRMPLHTDLVRLIGLLPVQRAAILPREHRDGTRAQLIGGAEGSDGDFTAVRDEDLTEHAHLSRGGAAVRHHTTVCLSVLTA